MATFTNEAFTAANGTQLVNMEGWARASGGAYQESNPIVQTNRVVNTTPAATGLFLHSGTPISADYSVTANIYVASMLSNTGDGPAGRADSTGANYYECLYLPETTRWRLSRVVDGVAQEIGSYSQTLTATNTHACKLEMIGDQIRVYIDTVERIAVTDVLGPQVAGKAGISSRGGGTRSTTTGLHFDSVTAEDTAPPEETITFVGVGATSVGQNGSRACPLPAGAAEGQLLVVQVYGANAAGAATATFPAGWSSVTSVGQGGRITWGYRIAPATPAAPTITYTGSGNYVAQMAAFEGVDPDTPLDAFGTVGFTGTSNANLGPIPGITPSVAKALVIVGCGRMGGDWTSVATLSGDGLTWAEIAEPDFTPQNYGMVWDYAIQGATPVAVTDKTFTVTGASGTYRGQMAVFRPAQESTPPGPTTRPRKPRAAGAFATKPTKVKIGGSFVTKVRKVIGVDTPGPPNPGTPQTVPIPTLTRTSVPQGIGVEQGTGSAQTLGIPTLSRISVPQSIGVTQGTPNPQGMRAIMWISDRFFFEYAASRQPEEPAIATSQDLADLKSIGIDGFSMAMGALDAPLDTDTARRLDDIAQFAQDHPEFKVLINHHTAKRGVRDITPYAAWYNDAGWNAAFDLAEMLGEYVGNSPIAGLTLDGEDYPSQVHSEGVRQIWWWPTSNQVETTEGRPTKTEAVTRAKVYERGRDFAEAAIAAGGPMEFSMYHAFYPGQPRERVQYEAQIRLGVPNPDPNNFRYFMANDWIDGISDAAGCLNFRHYDAAAFKSPQIAAGWDGWYEMSQAAWVQHGLNKPGCFVVPMVWLTQGVKARTEVANWYVPPQGPLQANGQPKPNAANPAVAFDRCWPAQDTILQLQKVKQFTQGGEFCVYDQCPVTGSAFRPRYPGIWPNSGTAAGLRITGTYGHIVDQLRITSG